MPKKVNGLTRLTEMLDERGVLFLVEGKLPQSLEDLLEALMQQDIISSEDNLDILDQAAADRLSALVDILVGAGVLADDDRKGLNVGDW